MQTNILRFVLLQTFSRHGIARASSALLIWLNENVLLITILLHRGEEHQHAYGCQHAAVNLTDGRSDESADDEQEAGEEGDVKRRTVRRQMRLRALTDKSDTST